MSIVFKDKYLEDLYEGRAVTRKPKYSKDVLNKFTLKVQLIENAETIKDLTKFRSLNFEVLKGDMLGLYSIRVDIKYRIIFSLERDKILIQDIVIIEELSKHYE